MRGLKLAFVFAFSGLVLVAGGYVPPSVGQRQPNIAFGGRAVAIAVHPNDPNKIVVASETGGLFRSLNQGATWTHVSGNTTFGFSDVIYVPSNPIILLASAIGDMRVVTGGGVWRSLNNGANWSQVSLAAPTCDTPYDFGANDLFAESGRDRIWVATTCGVAYSTDQGANWTFLPEAPGYVHETVYAVLAPITGRVVIRTQAGLRVSTDDGSNWTLSVPNLPQYSSIMGGAHNQVATAPNNPNHLYWAINYWHGTPHVALFRSTDNGAFWTAIYDNPGTNRPPFVRTALALSGDSAQYDVYSSDGAWAMQRRTADVSGSSLSAPTLLSMDHGDAADIGFGTDHKTPILLATDGGLHKTINSGASWTLAGGGASGYNALQITEVTGQKHDVDGSADLYFGTQDNLMWTSPNEGGIWFGGVGAEGVNLNVPRDYYPANQTQVTGRICVPCSHFIAGPLFANWTGFPNAPGAYRAPRLLQPGYYVQETWAPNQNGSVFALTINTGGSWNTRYSFPETPWDLGQLAGPANDPILFTAVRTSGLTPEGNPVVEIKRIADVLSNNTPLVSQIGDFGSLGMYANMMTSSGSFGVDPNNPNYLMVSDVVDKQVKVSTDGGATWSPDTALTDLVTQSGALRFDWRRGFSQTTVFGFDPECNGHILVGTNQAGVFETIDRGSTWYRLGNSDLIPQVSSIFFPGNDSAVISSYGRGLWRYLYTCPSRKLNFPKPIEFAEPIIFWEGARIPISQIHDPDACPACGYFLAIGGKILDYKTDLDTGQLTEVVLNRGEIKGYTWDAAEVPLTFDVLTERTGGPSAIDKGVKEFLNGGLDVKGLFLEGGVLRGLLIYSQDLTVDDLPDKFALQPYIRLIDRGPLAIDESEPIVLTGTGFDPLLPLEVFLDGQPVTLEAPPEFDAAGTFTLTFTSPLELGVHALRVSQGSLQDILTFQVTVHEAEELVP